MYFRNYGLQNTWVGKCLKMLVSEDLLKSNMLNGLKHFLNLHSKSSILMKYSWKKSFSVLCKIL